MSIYTSLTSKFAALSAKLTPKQQKAALITTGTALGGGTLVAAYEAVKNWGPPLAQLVADHPWQSGFSGVAAVTTGAVMAKGPHKTRNGILGAIGGGATVPLLTAAGNYALEAVNNWITANPKETIGMGAVTALSIPLLNKKFGAKGAFAAPALGLTVPPLAVYGWDHVIAPVGIWAGQHVVDQFQQLPARSSDELIGMAVMTGVGAAAWMLRDAFKPKQGAPHGKALTALAGTLKVLGVGALSVVLDGYPATPLVHYARTHNANATTSQVEKPKQLMNSQAPDSPYKVVFHEPLPG